MSLPHGLSDDTSLAVIAFGNGDKRLCFQESSGSVREALYTWSTEQWRADANNIVAIDAKNSTPLAVYSNYNTGSSGGLGTRVRFTLHGCLGRLTGVEQIYLFYITNGNRLAGRQFVSGTWTTRDDCSPSASGKISFSTATNSRALAVNSKATSLSMEKPISSMSLVTGVLYA